MASTTVLTYGELFALKTAGTKYVEHTVTEILSESEDGSIPCPAPTLNFSNSRFHRKLRMLDHRRPPRR